MICVCYNKGPVVNTPRTMILLKHVLVKRKEGKNAVLGYISLFAFLPVYIHKPCASHTDIGTHKYFYSHLPKG